MEEEDAALKKVAAATIYEWFWSLCARPSRPKEEEETEKEEPSPPAARKKHRRGLKANLRGKTAKGKTKEQQNNSPRTKKESPASKPSSRKKTSARSSPASSVSVSDTTSPQRISSPVVSPAGNLMARRRGQETTSPVAKGAPLLSIPTEEDKEEDVWGEEDDVEGEEEEEKGDLRDGNAFDGEKEAEEGDDDMEEYRVAHAAALAEITAAQKRAEEELVLARQKAAEEIEAARKHAKAEVEAARKHAREMEAAKKKAHDEIEAAKKHAAAEIKRAEERAKEIEKAKKEAEEEARKETEEARKRAAELERVRREAEQEAKASLEKAQRELEEARKQAEATEAARQHALEEAKHARTKASEAELAARAKAEQDAIRAQEALEAAHEARRKAEIEASKRAAEAELARKAAADAEAARRQAEQERLDALVGKIDAAEKRAHQADEARKSEMDRLTDLLRRLDQAERRAEQTEAARIAEVKAAEARAAEIEAARQKEAQEAAKRLQELEAARLAAEEEARRVAAEAEEIVRRQKQEHEHLVEAARKEERDIVAATEEKKDTTLVEDEEPPQEKKDDFVEQTPQNIEDNFVEQTPQNVEDNFVEQAPQKVEDNFVEQAPQNVEQVATTSKKQRRRQRRKKKQQHSTQDDVEEVAAPRSSSSPTFSAAVPSPKKASPPKTTTPPQNTSSSPPKQKTPPKKMEESASRATSPDPQPARHPIRDHGPPPTTKQLPASKLPRLSLSGERYASLRKKGGGLGRSAQSLGGNSSTARSSLSGWAQQSGVEEESETRSVGVEGYPYPRPTKKSLAIAKAGKERRESPHYVPVEEPSEPREPPRNLKIPNETPEWAYRLSSMKGSSRRRSASPTVTSPTKTPLSSRTEKLAAKVHRGSPHATAYDRLYAAGPSTVQKRDEMVKKLDMEAREEAVPPPLSERSEKMAAKSRKKLDPSVSKSWVVAELRTKARARYEEETEEHRKEMEEEQKQVEERIRRVVSKDTRTKPVPLSSHLYSEEYIRARRARTDAPGTLHEGRPRPPPRMTSAEARATYARLHGDAAARRAARARVKAEKEMSDLGECTFVPRLGLASAKLASAAAASPAHGDGDDGRGTRSAAPSLTGNSIAARKSARRTKLSVHERLYRQSADRASRREALTQAAQDLGFTFRPTISRVSRILGEAAEGAYSESGGETRERWQVLYEEGMEKMQAKEAAERHQADREAAQEDELANSFTFQPTIPQRSREIAPPTSGKVHERLYSHARLRHAVREAVEDALDRGEEIDDVEAILHLAAGAAEQESVATGNMATSVGESADWSALHSEIGDDEQYYNDRPAPPQNATTSYNQSPDEDDIDDEDWGVESGDEVYGVQDEDDQHEQDQDEDETENDTTFGEIVQESEPQQGLVFGYREDDDDEEEEDDDDDEGEEEEEGGLFLG